MTGVGKLVRVGIVSTVEDNRARVYYPGQNDMVSGWLYVLKTSESWMPEVNDRVLVLYSEGENTDGYILGVIQ